MLNSCTTFLITNSPSYHQPCNNIQTYHWIAWLSYACYIKQLVRILMKLRQAVIAFYYFHESDEKEKRNFFVNPIIFHTSETNYIKPGVLNAVNTKCPDSICSHPEQTQIHLFQCSSFSPLLSSPLLFPLFKLVLCEYRFRKSKSKTLSLLSLDEWVSLTMTLANATKKLLSGCGTWVGTQLPYQSFFDAPLQKPGNRGDLKAIIAFHTVQWNNFSFESLSLVLSMSVC